MTGNLFEREFERNNFSEKLVKNCIQRNRLAIANIPPTIRVTPTVFS